MASSAGDYEVITPVLTKAATVQDDSPINSAQSGLVKQEHDGTSVAKEVAQGTATDIDVEVPAASEEYVEGSTDSFTGIEINGTHYVEASAETHPWSCITVNGVKYVQQNMVGPYRKTADDLVCDIENVQADSQESPQQRHSREGYAFSPPNYMILTLSAQVQVQWGSHQGVCRHREYPILCPCFDLGPVNSYWSYAVGQGRRWLLLDQSS